MVTPSLAQEVPISEIMRKDPITVYGHESVGKAVDIMEEYRIRHLVVVSSAGVVCGLLSERDIFRSLAEHRTRMATIRDAMTAPVISAAVDMPVSAAAQLMRQQRIGCLLIVSSLRKLEGIVTRSDVLDFLIS